MKRLRLRVLKKLSTAVQVGDGCISRCLASKYFSIYVLHFKGIHHWSEGKKGGMMDINYTKPYRKIEMDNVR